MNRRFSLAAADVKIEDSALKAANDLMSSSKHPTFKLVMPQTYLERNYMVSPILDNMISPEDSYYVNYYVVVRILPVFMIIIQICL